MSFQSLGITNATDRSILKKKIRDMKQEVEKERKALEKELRNREKMSRKESRSKK